jgi:DNA replication protein DnaC/transposase
MLVVETIAKIRRAYFQDGKSIKQIGRELRVSRNTVRRVIRSGATEFTYERRVQPQPRIGPWRDELDWMLADNARKPKRERLTHIRIFEELRALGYEGDYDAVRRYAVTLARSEREASAAAYVPLSFDPGEAYQFDWSHEIVVIDGVTTTVKVAHVRLCHSRMVFVRAYPRETQEMVFDAHDKAFAFFGGACARGIYDNMKTAVDTIFVGRDRAYNRRFQQMCGHYLVEPVACTPASGWEKGQVFDKNRYSVDARAVGRPVEIRAYAERIEIWQEGKIVGEHARAFGRDKAIYDPLHYLPVLARKPGALRNGAPFKDWDLPLSMRRVQRKLGRVPNGDRQMVDILGAVLTDGLDAVEAACAEALHEGAPSSAVVLNILARHREPAPPLTIATPDALRLSCEPVADCRRYDSLEADPDMERSQVLDAMGQLKLYGMKAACDEIITTAVKRQHEPQKIVGDLLNAEISEKQARSIKYQLTIAKLPLAKEIDEFDFEDTPVNETLVRDLAGGDFLEQQRNVVLIGGTGTGKSHLAVAMARACIRNGARGRFFNVVDLVNKLDAEARADRQGRTADLLCRLDFVILDELGYLPFAQTGGQLLFHRNRRSITLVF